jgi:hypothetical protein
MTQTYTDFEFNYASFSLAPYSGETGSSSNLLKQVIQKLSDKDFPHDKKVIDRHINRKDTASRKLVIISNKFGENGTRCFGKIALIKNKAPLLWSGSDIVEEIEKEENKQFIEITNYCVHFSSGSDPIVMFEFNSEGPRLSDIEYYIRQIAKEFRLAKNIQTVLHLKISYEQLDSKLSNVFGMTVKVNSANNNKINWLKALKNINDDAGYKDIRLEFYYNRVKEQTGKFQKNIRGLDFARQIINWLKHDGKNIKYIDDLKMTYQIDDDDNIVDLDFKKNKVMSVLQIPLIDKKQYRSVDFRDIVGQEFNFYLKNGKTSFLDN